MTARLLFAAFLSAMMLAAGCGNSKAPQGRAVGSIALATLHCNAWYLLDRNGDGAADDPKPREEREAVLQQIVAMDADILALQDVGSDADVGDICRELSLRGLDYPLHALAPGKTRGGHAVLSRIPGTEFQIHTGMVYRIADRELTPSPAFIEARVPASKSTPALRMIAAFLMPGESDSRSPDTYEIRRNEARLLGQEIRRQTMDFPSDRILVLGSLNDLPGSGILRTITHWRDEKGNIADSGAWDDRGELWTSRDDAAGMYRKLDYILLNPEAMKHLAMGAARIVWNAGSIHPRRGVCVTLNP